MTQFDKEKPLVYSCSGCSNLAQLANDIALSMNADGVAEMSCIAGLGGNVKSLVRRAKSGRPIIAVDGCPLHCVRHCLARHELEADYHFELSKITRIKKAYGLRCSDADVAATKWTLYQSLTLNA